MRQNRQAFALLGALAFAAGPLAAEMPEWLERWLYNPRERTLLAAAAGRRGDVEGSAAALETALRLAPEDPTVQYNAGTARLATGGDAASLLESAARLGHGAVVPRAYYNLGNARMQGEDLQGAVEAYRDALRRDGGDADAKFNLELAQRLLEEQQRQPPPPPEEQEPPPEPEPQPQPDPEQEPDDARPEDERQDPRQDDARGQSPLPQFRDLPDMSAEEAAAILEAVENMERERRREEAREASRRRPRTEKDW
ncbi:MAG TPA: tetratricopeptide repeat protein [Thermoanaerobaculia bacterium]